MIKNKLLIVGFGNTWRQDDGVGPKIVSQLQEKAIEGVEYWISESDVFSLLDAAEQFQTVLIVDAVQMDELAGTVKLFRPHEVKLILSKDSTSTHGFGLAELIKLLELIGAKTNCQILGIQPDEIALGEQLSSTLQLQWLTIMEKVNDYISSLLEEIEEIL